MSTIVAPKSLSPLITTKNNSYYKNIYQNQNFQPSQTKKNLSGKIFPLKIENDARNSCNLQSLTMTFFETKYRKPYSL